MTSGTPSAPDSAHFLSPRNPLATADQRDMEARAMRIAGSPRIVEARAKVERLWRSVAGQDVGEKAWALFDGFIDEYVFHYVLVAVNSDPDRPMVQLVFTTPEHEWFGMHVPGSRTSGGTNPDNSNRLVPIDPAARYEVTGRRFAPAPEDVVFELKSNDTYSRTFRVLEKRDLRVNDDGSYTVTVDPSAADGRANHLQTTPETTFLYVRNSRSDWRQVPDALRVRRIDPPRTATRPSDDEIAQRAVALMIDNVPNNFWWMRISLARPANTMPQPRNTGEVGGLSAQETSLGRAELADDEALVITASAGSATYHSLAIYDYWYRAIDPARHQGSFNNAQARANADGTFTYVIAARDPGVWNWLDTAGQHQLLLIYRWQGLGGKPAARPIAIDARRVRIDQLEAVLPADVARITPAQRREQVSERIRLYRDRFAL